MTKRRANSWDRKVRRANVALSDVDRGRICQQVIKAFPNGRTVFKKCDGSVDRSMLAALAIFCAERTPAPETVEIAKGLWPSTQIRSRGTRMSAILKLLSALRDAGVLKETYETRFVGRTARRFGGGSTKTGMSQGHYVKGHTAHWSIINEEEQP